MKLIKKNIEDTNNEKKRKKKIIKILTILIEESK